MKKFPLINGEIFKKKIRSVNEVSTETGGVLTPAKGMMMRLWVRW